MQVTSESAALPPYESVIPAQSGISRIALRFTESLSELLFQSSPSSIAIALSGGADSMALTLLAQDYARARNCRMVVLTVDHRLRAESAAEALQVATWMLERGIEHHILTPEHRDISNNLQEAARTWRYDALAEYCQAHGILHCLVAHQAGDNRETLLHHQQRGNTPDGTAGMARARNYRGVRFLRPLLGFERRELEDFLRTENVSWVEDPSNQNMKFARVRHRAALEENAGHHATLDVALKENAAARTARDHALAEAAIHCVRIDPLGYAEISRAKLMALESMLASQLMADCVATISGGVHRPRAADTARIMQALHQPNFRKRTLQQCEITLKGDVIMLAREASRVELPLTVTGSGMVMWDQRFRVRFNTNEAYTLRALGADGRQALKALKYRVNLPLATPSLWYLDKLVYVPYIEGMAQQQLHGTVEIGFAPAKPLAPAAFW